MREIAKILIFIVSAMMGSCVEPLVLDPDIAGDIVAMEVEGQTRVPTVNPSTRTVNIEVGEGVDLAAVRVTRIEYVQTASGDIAAGSVLDLRTPLRTIVTTIAGYEWTITAAKHIVANRPLPGGSFDEWSSTGSRPTWNPWAEGGILGESRWWDTGNKGVTTIAPSNSTPTEPGERRYLHR